MIFVLTLNIYAKEDNITDKLRQNIDYITRQPGFNKKNNFRLNSIIILIHFE
jgi:hypothetical protein